MGTLTRPPAALLVLLTGCVVRYAPPPEGATESPLPPPVDFGEVDARLDSLLVEPRDVDQRDRLQAALVLSRKAKTDDAATQRVVLTYLQQVLAIEERSRTYAAPVLPPVPSVQTFEPVAPEPVMEAVLDDEEGDGDRPAPPAGGKPDGERATVLPVTRPSGTASPQAGTTPVDVVPAAGDGG